MKKASSRPCRQRPANPRELAWRALCHWGEKTGEFADTLIHRAGENLTAPDRALLQSIVLGTLRNLRLLDYWLNELRDERHTEKDVRWLLLSALCQLFILHYPAYAVVNETVKLATTRLRAVINGVLRESLRRREQWEAALPELPPAVRYSMPDWLAERWLARFGEQEGAALLALMQQPSQVFLRLNAINPPAPVPESWTPLADAPGWYLLPEGALPRELLTAGQVYIADPSTRHSVELLNPSRGEKILDACAAPGGKSVGILSATRGDCQLVATDSDDHRLPMLKQNLERATSTLERPDVRVQQCDWALGCPAEFVSSFDAVLADVPCSNSGVLRRRVDVRWRITPDELKKTRDLQLTIAQNSMRAVKPGGRLVYSTCSIEPEENHELVQLLLERHPGWQLVDERLVLPHRDHTDGAYAALLRAPRID